MAAGAAVACEAWADDDGCGCGGVTLSEVTALVADFLLVLFVRVGSLGGWRPPPLPLVLRVPLVLPSFIMLLSSTFSFISLTAGFLVFLPFPVAEEGLLPLPLLAFAVGSSRRLEEEVAVLRWS